MAITIISQEELLKLASLSCIKLEEHEIEPLKQSLEAVLAYASRLKDVAALYADSSQGASVANVFRQDSAHLCTEGLVERAPVYENNYFVVPVIIKQS